MKKTTQNIYIPKHILMSLSQAQTTEIKLHPLFFLQEKQHQRRGEIVNVITESSDITESGDILLLEEFYEFCIVERGPRWGWCVRVSVRVPAAPTAPWSPSRVFNFWVHEMRLGAEVMVFTVRISPFLTWRAPLYLTWISCQASVFHDQPMERSCYFWAGAGHTVSEIKGNIANYRAPEYWNLGYCMFRCFGFFFLLDWKFFDVCGATSGDLFWVISTLVEDGVWGI